MKLLTALLTVLLLCTPFAGYSDEGILGNYRLNECEGKIEKFDSREKVLDRMKMVADWQIRNFTYRTEGNLHDYGIDAWTNGVLYLGMSRWASIATNDTLYYNWLRKIGDDNNWKIPANFRDYVAYQMFHADELCVAQFYLAMYEKYQDPRMISSIEERLDWIMNTPKKESMNYKNKQVWSWCDALFMAPPVYAEMARIKSDSTYLKYMDEQFKKTYDHLYDSDAGLFFRDDSYFSKREANGQKVFWGRGNAWVVAGLANILEVLPADASARPFYEDLFKRLALRLQSFQDENGFWHASLLDPESYPAPETSATAMIVFAMAYGINNGLLDSDQFGESVCKGWNALNSVVDDSGKLGFIQPIGADPQKITADMTAVYGIGAYLMAGVEIYNLIQ